jgi:hypothetical protein
MQALTLLQTASIKPQQRTRLIAVKASDNRTPHRRKSPLDVVAAPTALQNSDARFDHPRSAQ